MSTTPKQPQPTPIQPIKAASARPAATNRAATKTDQNFLFDKENYMLMIGGVVLILLGFVLMAGGKSPDPHQFNYAEIYSFRRITLAPIVILAGFGLEVYAIMKKPKETPQIA